MKRTTLNALHLTRRGFVQHVAAASFATAATWQRVLGAEPTVAAPLRNAMDRAAKCCLAWLNPDQDFLPTGGYEVAHDTGRWWDAMLRYEAATGEHLPEQAETPMLKEPAGVDQQFRRAACK